MKNNNTFPTIKYLLSFSTHHVKVFYALPMLKMPLKEVAELSHDLKSTAQIREMYI